jgi:predicted DNA-binding transcriptional regulator AlpA
MPSNGRHRAIAPQELAFRAPGPDAAPEAPRSLPALVSVDGGLLGDVRGAARLVGVSPGSLYRMIAADAFPDGRHYPGLPPKRKAWRVDDVAAWVDEHFPSQRSD